MVSGHLSVCSTSTALNPELGGGSKLIVILASLCMLLVCSRSLQSCYVIPFLRVICRYHKSRKDIQLKDYYVLGIGV